MNYAPRFSDYTEVDEETFNEFTKTFDHKRDWWCDVVLYKDPNWKKINSKCFISRKHEKFYILNEWMI